MLSKFFQNIMISYCEALLYPWYRRGIHLSKYQEKVVSIHPYVCSFRWELQTAARPSCHMHIGCIKIKGYHLHSFSNFLLKWLTISNNTACNLQKIIQIDMNLLFLFIHKIRKNIFIPVYVWNYQFTSGGLYLDEITDHSLWWNLLRKGGVTYFARGQHIVSRLLFKKTQTLPPITN